MIKGTDRRAARLRRHARIRRDIKGTAERPRLSVFRSLSHIYAQVIDDEAGHTLVSCSSVEPEVKQQIPYGGNTEAAKLVGKLIASRALAKGIRQVVFDRGGNLYHGRVKALADGAREAGLEF